MQQEHTRRTAARVVGKSLRQLDELLSRKVIRSTRIGGRLRISHSELERFLAASSAPVTQAERLRSELARYGISVEDLASFPEAMVLTGKIKKITSGELDADPSDMPRLIALISFVGTKRAQEAIPA